MLVVMGHFLLPLSKPRTPLLTNLLYSIYAFHMPAFALISGYLGRGSCSESYSIIKPLSMLKMYIVFKLILFFSEGAAYGFTGRYPDILHESGAPWYLLALMLWYLPLKFIPGKRSMGQSLLIWFITLLLGLLGGYLNRLFPPGLDSAERVFLSLDRVTALMPFFYAGYLIPLQKIAGIRRDYGCGGIARRLPAVLSIIVITALLLFTRAFLMPYRLTVYGAYYSRYPLDTMPLLFAEHPWLLRLIWYALALLLCYGLYFFSPGKKCMMSDIGRRSLQIYIFHRPVRDLLMALGFFDTLRPESTLHVFLLLIISAVLTVLLSHPLFERLISCIRSLPEGRSLR